MPTDAHYRTIAFIISVVVQRKLIGTPRHVLAILAADLAEFFAKENPGFNRGHFFTACSLPDPTLH